MNKKIVAFLSMIALAIFTLTAATPTKSQRFTASATTVCNSAVAYKEVRERVIKDSNKFGLPITQAEEGEIQAAHIAYGELLLAAARTKQDTSCGAHDVSTAQKVFELMQSLEQDGIPPSTLGSTSQELRFLSRGRLTALELESRKNLLRGPEGPEGPSPLAFP